MGRLAPPRRCYPSRIRSILLNRRRRVRSHPPSLRKSSWINRSCLGDANPWTPAEAKAHAVPAYPVRREDSIDTEERLQRVLAARGAGSRRRAEAFIVAGRVMVDGKVVTALGTKVDPRSAELRLDGKLLRPQSLRYVLLNKPTGYITTTSDERGRRTVMDLVASRERIYPVGRLDRDTEGLLLLTNDGEVAHHVMHPRYGLAKEYHILTHDRPSDRTMQRVRDGVLVETRQVVPDEFRLLRETREGILLTMILHEGMFHVVRRIMETVGIAVEQLRRVRLGPLTLTGIPLGGSRDLTPGEQSTLLEALRIDRALNASSPRRRSPSPIRHIPPPPSARPRNGASSSGDKGAPMRPSLARRPTVAPGAERAPKTGDKSGHPDSQREGTGRSKGGSIARHGRSQGKGDPPPVGGTGSRDGKDERRRQQPAAAATSSSGGPKPSKQNRRIYSATAAPITRDNRRDGGRHAKADRKRPGHGTPVRSDGRPPTQRPACVERPSVKQKRHRNEAPLRPKRAGEGGSRGDSDVERTESSTGGGH